MFAGAARGDRRCRPCAGCARLLAPPIRCWPARCSGCRFPGPLGLAAGFDKDGLGLNTWGALGFGYAEVGTVTAQPQPGNPHPRLFRLPADRALLNRMGFNNHGAGALAPRLARHHAGRADRRQHRQDQDHPARRAVEDYRASARLLGPLASYLVVNVSSPNTPGCAICRPSNRCGPSWRRCCAETSTPVLVKIAPDLSDADIDDIADLAVELGLAGIVATNTTVSRDGLATPGVDELGPGGISGPPVARTRRWRCCAGCTAGSATELVLISVGGIETADDAWERITAGASLAAGLHRVHLRRRPVGQDNSRRYRAAAARRRVRIAARRSGVSDLAPRSAPTAPDRGR